MFHGWNIVALSLLTQALQAGILIYAFGTMAISIEREFGASRAQVMLADWGAEAHEVAIVREVPGGTNQLPTAALGPNGGGRFAVDPRAGDGRTTLERVFQIELALPPAVWPPPRTGSVSW